MARSGDTSLRLRETLEKLWSEIAARSTDGAPTAMSSAELFLRSPEGSLRVGVDGAGHRHLLIPVERSDRPLDDDRSAGVVLRTRDLVAGELPLTFLDLECRRADLDGVFTGLCSDVCEIVVQSDVRVGGRVLAALSGWRELLSRARQPWTRERIAGLHGELRLLLRLLEVNSGSADLWSGPFGAPHDFRSELDALEVKTTIGISSRVVRIHGIDQLEKPASGSLTLVWSRLVVSPSGRTTADLLNACLERAADPSVIVHATDEIGLPDRNDPLMCDLKLDPSEERWFDVDADFPRITPDVFVSGAIPGGLGGVEYSLDLDTVGAWNGPDENVIARLVTAQ